MNICPICNEQLNSPSLPLGEVREGVADVQALLADLDSARQRQDEIARAQCATLLTSALNAADLPEPLKGDVRDRFQGRIFAADELAQSIEAKKALWAKLLEDQVVKGLGQPRSLSLA